MARALSRRALLAMGAGAAAAATLGGTWALRRDSSTPAAGPAATVPATNTPARSVTPSPTPGSAGRPPVPGGVARLVARGRFSFDTFDALRTGEPSVVEVLGRTHQRIVDWSSFGDGVLGPGLALHREQASDSAWVFELDPSAMWSGPGEPQPVVAEDVAIHLQRLLEHVANGALPLSQRPWHYASIERVEALSDSMLRIDTSAPDPFLLETLAGPFASVQSPAAIEAFGPLLHERRPEHLIGSGPFLYRGTDELGALLFERRDGSPALLDGLVVAPAGGTLAGFQELLLDEFIARDRRDAAAIREGAGRSLVEETIFEDSPIVSTFSVGAPPWDNPGLRQAISGALNRAWLVEALFGGRAVPSAHIARSSARPFLAPAAELARFPGFETDAQAGASEARARWDAAGGGSVGALTVDFPAVFDPLYGASAIVTARLSEVLGVEVRPAVDSYTNIAGKLAAGGYGNGDPAFWFGWDAAVVSPEPSRTLIERFLSNSATAATHGFADEGIDRLLSSLGGAFDMEQRAALAMEVEASLLENAGGGIIPWVLQQSEHFRRAYLAGAPRTPFGDQHLDASRWLDRQGPGFGDRPA